MAVILNALFFRSRPKCHALCRFWLCTLSFPVEIPQTASQDIDVATVYKIVCNSSSADDLRQSLKSSRIFLSNDLIDKVLKRARFAHGHPLKALEFFNCTGRRKGFYHSAFSFDTMLYILGRNRKFDLIWKLLEDAKKDPNLVTARTVHVVIGRIAKVCSVRMTVESFWKFKRIVPEFDVQCFNALFRSLSQEKSMSDTRNVYHQLKMHFKPNLYTFNTLLSGWKSAEDAEQLFLEMRDFGVNPDIVSYNSLLDVYCKAKEMEKAFKLMEKMRDEEVEPDVITYTSIIGGLGLVGQPDKAEAVLKEMKEHGCYPDAAAYNAVIRNYCIAKRLKDACRLMTGMGAVGLSPNATTYNLFFRALYWCNDLASSWSVYARMMRAGCLPNTQSCMFLVRLCRRHERTDLALHLWRDMVEKDFGSFILVSDVLLDLLCDMGLLAEAEQCFMQMVEKRHKPSQASFRRIRALLLLVGRHDTIRTLSEGMAMLGSSVVAHSNSDLVDDLCRVAS